MVFGSDNIDYDDKFTNSQMSEKPLHYAILVDLIGLHNRLKTFIHAIQ